MHHVPARIRAVPSNIRAMLMNDVVGECLERCYGEGFEGV